MGFYTDSEIIGMFRNSLDPESQIDILSQLNCCTQNEIRAILANHGIDVNTRPRTRSLSKNELDSMFRPCYMEGMHDDKIAKICGTSTKTVQRWRARNNLPPN